MRVGVIGGGQLARMLIGPAVELGVDLRVFADAPEPAAGLVVTATGDHRDIPALLDFAATVDVVTFDHEQVPQDVLAALASAGGVMFPGPAALRAAQDKHHMRERLGALGLPVPAWTMAHDPDAVAAFLAAHGGTVIAKTPRGGYDGHGVCVVSTPDAVTDWLAVDPAGGILLEERVQFQRELAQLVARSASGEHAVWPLAETVQCGGVCHEVIAPPPHATARLTRVAAELAVTIADALEVVGVLAVELFETTDDRLLVNELAMRPHNSGHWTQDGAVTSQFEQHLRAVLDLPLGSTEPLRPWAVMVNRFGVDRGAEAEKTADAAGDGTGQRAARIRRALRGHPAVKVHDYGKTERLGRKIGHVTAIGDDLDAVSYAARAVVANLAE